jgi:hypothetical protein
MATNDPAEIAAEMLRERLPGFAADVDAMRDTVRIKGYLRVGQEITGEAIREAVHYPVPKVIGFGDEPPRYTREELEREVEPTVAYIVEGVQRFAIKAVGLEAYIAERERVAHGKGQREGIEIGRADGIREGRADLLREWFAAIGHDDE